jgi:hypothetical protein
LGRPRGRRRKSAHAPKLRRHNPPRTREWGHPNGSECSPEQRWKDNWREALKGLPVLTEAFDEQGIYLSTEHTSYELRELYTGRDGRHVMVSYPVGKESFLYDTEPGGFDHSSSTVAMDEITFAFQAGGLDPVATTSRQVPKRASSGTARVRTSTTYDDFGNTLTSTRAGCVEGCPNGPDEVITATSIFSRPSGDDSGWLFREMQSSITGSAHTNP